MVIWNMSKQEYKGLSMDSENKYKKANNLYRECKMFFGGIDDYWNECIEDEEERGFYRVVSDYFLQQRQKEVIEKKLF